MVLTDAPVMLSRVNGREQNEDAFLACTFSFPDGTPARLLLLADGMGGHAHGELFSRETIRKCAGILFETLVIQAAIQQQTPPAFVPEQIPAKLWQVVQMTCQQIQRLMDSNHWEHGGATLVLALLTPRGAWAVNVGDSPLFHYQVQSGSLSVVSEDHSVPGILLKQGLISPLQARYHEDRHRLAHYIGRGGLPAEPCVKPLSLAAGDILLLCSDGVSNHLSPELLCAQLPALAAEGLARAEALCDQAVAEGESDNQTLICWQIPPEFSCQTVSVSAPASTVSFTSAPFAPPAPAVAPSPVASPSPVYAQLLESRLVPLPVASGLSGLTAVPDTPDWNPPFGCLAAPRQPDRQAAEVFLMSTPVTRELWQRMGLPLPEAPEAARHPITNCSLAEINALIARLNEQDTQWHYRLPCLAEWLAASAGLVLPLNLNQLWCNENSPGSLQPVGQQGEQGAFYYDLFGHVWEWVTDTQASTGYVLVGGAHDTPQRYCHPAVQLSVPDTLCAPTIGFRLLASRRTEGP